MKLSNSFTAMALATTFSLLGMSALPAQAKYNKPMRWPVESHTVTATFHDPSYIFRNYFEHDGIDIANAQGSPVYAAKDGVVVVAHMDEDSADYAYLMLAHKHNLSTVYGEVTKVLVKKGEVVKRGQLIAYSGGLPGTVGAGAYTTGSHLHFSVRKNGLPVNPLRYLKSVSQK